MLFKSRDVNPNWDPLEADDLRVGGVYFSLGFADNSFHVPSLDTMVLVEVSERNGTRVFLFQLATAYFSGISYDAAGEHEVPMLFEYDEDSLNSIFDFDGVLEQFLVCALHRQGAI